MACVALNRDHPQRVVIAMRADIAMSLMGGYVIHESCKTALMMSFRLRALGALVVILVLYLMLDDILQSHRLARVGYIYIELYGCH